MLVILSIDKKGGNGKEGITRRSEWNVILVDGHSPRLIFNGRQFNTTLEPTSCARWCKVLSLKSVHVVCSKMKLCWCTNAERTDDVIIQDNNTNDNSLINLALNILEENGSDEKENTFEEKAKVLMQMLHCYILPIVNFKSKDIQQIVNALSIQDTCVECLDANIMSQTKRVEGLCSALMTYLEAQLGPKIEYMCSKNECPQEFLEIIIKDLSKQELDIRQKFDRYQFYVDEAKASLACINSVSNREQLTSARKRRDTYFNRLQAILHLRENILDILKNMPILEEHHQFDSVLMQDYMNIRQQAFTEKEKLRNLCKMKVCALTLRESLYTLREELTHQGFSQGTGYYCDSCLDVDGASQGKTDFQTTSEKLAVVLQTNRQLKICDIEFVEKTEKFCQEIMQVLVEGGVPEEQRVITWQTVSNAVKSLLKKMKSNVKNHLHKFAPELAVAMGVHFRSHGDVEVQIQTIQLSYEEHFFEKLGRCIEIIYEMINEETVDHIISAAVTVKNLNLDFLIKDLQLKEEWWLVWFSEGEVCKSSHDSIDGYKKQMLARGMSCPESSDIVCESSSNGGTKEMEKNLKELYQCGFKIKSQQIVLSMGENSTYVPRYTPVLPSKVISPVRVGKRPRSLSMELLGLKRKPRSHSCPENKPPETDAVSDSMAKILSLLEPPVDEVDNAKLKCTSKNGWLVVEEDEDILETPEMPNEDGQEDLSEKHPEFLKHFGRILTYIRDMFHEPSPINKLKCLRAALMELTSAVEELRYQKCKDYHKNAVAAEDLLPLIILMLRELEPNEIGLLYTQIAFLEDYMASFLSSGAYSWSLTMFTASHKELVDIGKRDIVTTKESY